MPIGIALDLIVHEEQLNDACIFLIHKDVTEVSYMRDLLTKHEQLM